MRYWRPVPALVAAGLLIGLGPGTGAIAEPGAGYGIRPAVQENGKSTPDADGTRPANEAERKSAIASIEGQLKAFREDDYEKATKYQCLELRKGFKSSEEFRRAIKVGYPQFANYKTVMFGEAICDEKGERLHIRITLTGQDGVVVRALYLMIKEEGEYRVGGVFGGAKSAPDPRNIT